MAKKIESAEVGDTSDRDEKSAFRSKRTKKRLGLLVLIGAAVLAWQFCLAPYLTITEMARLEDRLRQGYANEPIWCLFVAFVVYVVAIGLSLPVSTFLSLVYAWLFGWVAVPLLNLAATTGATIAFLCARYIFRDWVQNRFHHFLQPINAGFHADGFYYVISLRLIALFPFFVVNLVVGLIPIRCRTYVAATMIGMIPLNIVFVYLGMQIPSFHDISEDGIRSFLSWQILFGFGLIGLIPLAMRWVGRCRQRSENLEHTR